LACDSSGGELVLGIDASTTACKAIVWDLNGRAVAEGRAALPLLKPRPLWHEQRAEAWWEALMAATRQAVGDQKSIAERIAALCIAPQRETFVPAGADGTPLRNAIVWMDERAGALLPEIAADYGAERIHAETGKPLSGNLSLGKIRWLQRHEPEVFERTRHYLDVAGYLIYRLTGLYRTGWGCVDPMGLFDMRTHTWNVPLLDYLGVSTAQMPEAFPPGAVIGELAAQAAEACGLRAGLPVVAGVGDGQAGGLGAGVTQPGQAYLNLGTAVVSGSYSERYIVDRAFRTMYAGVPGAYSLETVLLGGTYTIDWFIEKMAPEHGGTASVAERLAPYNAALDEIPAGAEGLVVVPYWNSAMTPYWDAGASGITVGWRGIHTPAHLYRAILEGIAYEQRLHTEGVEAALGQPIGAFVVMGGGARNVRWCQILADVTGKPVVRTAASEAAALGAGIQAAVGAGLFAEMQTGATQMAPAMMSPILPDAARQAVYHRLYAEVYQELFPALQPSLNRLTALTEER
jgi:sugar (pentulose or hexulose) kinase